MLIVIGVICFVGYSFIIFEQYTYSSISENELDYVTDIYVDYTDTNNSYRIKCANGNYFLPKVLLKKDEVKSINPDDTLYLGLYKDKTILTIKVNDNDLISIDDCHNKYARQYKLSLFIVSCATFLIVGISIGVNLIKKKSLQKDDERIKKEVEQLDINKINKKIYNEIIESIQKIEGKYYCSILNKIEDDALNSTFVKAMLDYLDEDEIYLMIDSSGKDESLALIFYKLNNKLFFDISFKNDNNKFDISNDLLWYYPSIKPTKEECLKFKKAVDKFLLDNENVEKYQ